MFTYAQNFEDVLLERCFPGVSDGFYIDIGAWHPSQHSVTRYFYDKGWSGVNVEPIHSLYSVFVEERVRDININAAVGEKISEIRFYECTELTSLSTVDLGQAQQLRTQGYSLQEYSVPLITLNEISNRVGSRTVDFLKVDVEGHEAAVLRGADWKTFRPRVLVIEATIPNVRITDWENIEEYQNWNSWEPYLLNSGYIFAWFDGLSRFYVRQEDSTLRKRLSYPPCLHDLIEYPQIVYIEKKYTELLSDRAHILENALELEEKTKALTIKNNSLIQTASIERGQRERAIAELAIAKLAVEAKNIVVKEQASDLLRRKTLLFGIPDLLINESADRNSLTYARFIKSSRDQHSQHVAIDTLEIIFGVSGGVETYMKMLTNALIKSGKSTTLICLPEQLESLRAIFSTEVSYLVMESSDAREIVLRGKSTFLRQEFRARMSNTLATFSRLKEDFGIDIIHSPIQLFSVTDFTIPSVLNLHDLQHLHFPENFHPGDVEARKRLYGLSASLADAIIVSSEFVKNDLVEKMFIPPSKIFTIPVTWNPSVVEGLNKFSVDQARARYALPDSYVIYPAQFWVHKNHVRLIEALKIVRSSQTKIDLKLLLTGYRGHTGWPAVEEAIKRAGLHDHVICLDHVPVDHLAALYTASLFCVMPSTFEASSYPVIEAQYLGVAAMCSNITSLPELMKEGAGLLFDPYDSNDIADKMLRWILKPEDRAPFIERAKQRVIREHSIENYLSKLNLVYTYVQSQTHIEH